MRFLVALLLVTLAGVSAGPHHRRHQLQRDQLLFSGENPILYGGNYNEPLIQQHFVSSPAYYGSNADAMLYGQTFGNVGFAQDAQPAMRQYFENKILFGAGNTMMPANTKKTQFADVVTNPPLYAAPLVNKNYIEQPIIAPHKVLQTVVQPHLYEVPILRQHLVNQPIIRPIVNQPVIQPHIVDTTTVKTRLVEADIVQPKVMDQTIIQPLLQEQRVDNKAKVEAATRETGTVTSTKASLPQPVPTFAAQIRSAKTTLADGTSITLP